VLLDAKLSISRSCSLHQSTKGVNAVPNFRVVLQVVLLVKLLIGKSEFARNCRLDRCDCNRNFIVFVHVLLHNSFFLIECQATYLMLLVYVFRSPIRALYSLFLQLTFALCIAASLLWKI
jgi:hypothetical protein